MFASNNHEAIRQNIMTGSMSDRQCTVRQRVNVTSTGLPCIPRASLGLFRTSVQKAKETLGINNQCISASTVRRHERECDIGSQKAYRGNVLMPAC